MGDRGPFPPVAGKWFLGKLLDCFYCLSIWIALPFAIELGEGLKEKLLLWPALSGGASLLHRITEPAPPSAHYVEDNDVVLRRKEGPGRNGEPPTSGGAE